MKRRDRLTHLNRCMPARRYRIHPDLDRPHFVVEVHIARTKRGMRQALRQQGFAKHDHLWAAAHVISRTHDRWRPLYNGRVVAKAFFYKGALRHRPNELVAHEMSHAAMAWARFRKADLSIMGSSPDWRTRKDRGEELLCYAAGELVEQMAACCRAFGAWEK